MDVTKRQRAVTAFAVAGAVAVTSMMGSVSAAGAAGSWGPVVNLSGAAPAWTVVPTSVAVDDRGDTFAVWVHTDESRAPLMAAFRPRGKRWRAPVAVPGTRAATDADVGFAGDGEAVIVWTTERKVGAVRRSAGGSWSDPVTVWRSRTRLEPRPPNSVQLAVNRRGRAVALFSARRTLAAIGFPDGTWGKPRNPAGSSSAEAAATLSARTGPTSASGDTDVVIDRWGRATVVWREGIWFVGRIMTSYKDPGRPWSNPEAVTSPKFVSGSGQIAVRGDGTVGLAWTAGRRGSAVIRVARRTRDGDWVRSRPLVYDMDALKFRMAMDGAGRITVVWLNDRGALWRVDHVPGDGWTRMTRVMRPGTAGDEYGVVANEAGHVMIGSTGPAARPVWALRRSPDGVWAEHPRTVSKGGGQARGPAIGIGSSGEGVLVWTFQPAGSSQGRVQAARFVP